ncbi:MAG: hypothetical protein LBU32_20725 [Clostridiales bacterium]|jgi:hypothetical protein|nr:hypothetical protein [Clostridiales bacterium]
MASVAFDIAIYKTSQNKTLKIIWGIALAWPDMMICSQAPKKAVSYENQYNSRGIDEIIRKDLLRPAFIISD